MVHVGKKDNKKRTTRKNAIRQMQRNMWISFHLQNGWSRQVWKYCKCTKKFLFIKIFVEEKKVGMIEFLWL